MIELIDAHKSLWARMEPLLNNDSLPQAMLMVGPRHAALLPFVLRLMAAVLCESDKKPCGECHACRWVLEQTHPDVLNIRQATATSPIKIEQIRELQQTVYQTPQRGKRRFILIDPAERMNVASANALLKILEEPPAHTIFILMAEQVGSLPATILSRCQRFILQPPDQCIDYLGIAQYYPPDTSRAKLAKDTESIIRTLCELRQGAISPCTVAAQWLVYGFEDIVWLLYLIIAQGISIQLVNAQGALTRHDQMGLFSGQCHALHLFKQLDKIHEIMQKLNHSMNMNQTLVLEDLLFGFLE
jgi:DNA polymerase-3 subunit delta'